MFAPDPACTRPGFAGVYAASKAKISYGNIWVKNAERVNKSLRPNSQKLAGCVFQAKRLNP